MPLDDSLENKLELLKQTITGYQSAVVAFSGGVDSTFLTMVTYQVLGRNMLAVTARSETYVDRELHFTQAFAAQHHIPHQVIETSELAIENFADNPPDRCYYCKKELYTKLNDIKEAHHFLNIFDGSNLDDQSDYRPGSNAVTELGIRRPLLEVGLTKREIRELSKQMDLPTHDKPAIACLSSRFPYGTRITQDNINRVGAAEDFIYGLGIRQLRVRYHGDIARIETDEASLATLLDHRQEVVAALKKIGFNYVTLDMEGYRTGSMNETLLHR